MGNREDFRDERGEREQERRPNIPDQQRHGPGRGESSGGGQAHAGNQAYRGPAPYGRAEADYPGQRGFGGGGGYGIESRDESGHGRGYRPTYADDDPRSAQRSQWREGARNGGPAYESDIGAIDSRDQSGINPRQEQPDFEPHYHTWREQQLANHDRDYARWRDQQASRYDAEYRNWRDQRHDSFSREFADWRARGVDSPTGAEGSTAPDEGASFGITPSSPNYAGGPHAGDAQAPSTPQGGVRKSGDDPR